MEGLRSFFTIQTDDATQITEALEEIWTINPNNVVAQERGSVIELQFASAYMHGRLYEGFYNLALDFPRPVDIPADHDEQFRAQMLELFERRRAQAAEIYEQGLGLAIERAYRGPWSDLLKAGYDRLTP